MAPRCVIPYSRFDTSSEEAKRRLELWREAIGLLFEVRPAAPEAADAPVVLENWRFGPAVLTVAQGPAFFYDRSARAVARDGRDMFMVQVYEAGRSRVLRGAEPATSGPGDLMVTDLARPIATEETAFRNISLLLPRSALAPHLRAPDTQGGRVLQRDLPLVGLTCRHLRELVGVAGALTEEQAMEAFDATARLIAATLNGHADAATAGGVQVALACQVRRFIEEHLDAHDLSPEGLALRFGLSRATLYRLFREEGGVRQYVQRRRLARARLAILRPSERHRTVAEIGAAAGYSHAQDFIRAYRRAHGKSPGEEREESRMAGRARLSRPTARLPLWAQWVREIA